MDITEEQKHAATVSDFAAKMAAMEQRMQEMMFAGIQNVRAVVLEAVNAPKVSPPVNHAASAIMPRAPEPYSVVYTQPATKEAVFEKPAAKESQ